MRLIAALLALLVVAPSFAFVGTDVTVVGVFDHYVSTTQLDYLVIDTDGKPGLVYIVCTENHPSGCDDLNAGDRVVVDGRLEAPMTIDDGNTLFHLNRVIPEEVTIIP